MAELFTVKLTANNPMLAVNLITFIKVKGLLC